MEPGPSRRRIGRGERGAAGDGETLRLAAEARLVGEGTPADQLFTVVDGALRLVKTAADGRRQVVGFALRGDLVGLPGLGHYPYHVEALVPTSVACTARVLAERRLRRDAELAWRTLCRITAELALAQEGMLLLGRKSAEERVASFILAWCRRQGLAEGVEAWLPMSRRDIADSIGLRAESLCRVLRRLDDQGLIRLSGTRRLAVLDMAGLERIGAGVEAAGEVQARRRPP